MSTERAWRLAPKGSLRTGQRLGISGLGGAIWRLGRQHAEPEEIVRNARWRPGLSHAVRVSIKTEHARALSAYINNIDHQRLNVWSGFVVYQNLFLDGIADHVDYKTPPFEIQGERSSDGLRRGACNNHDFEPGTISCLLGSPLLAMPFRPHQDVRNATNRDQPNCNLNLIRGDPVVESNVHRGGSSGVNHRPRRRGRARASRLREPRSTRERISQSI